MKNKLNIFKSWENSYHFLLRVGAFCAGMVSILSFLTAIIGIMLLLASAVVGPAAAGVTSVSFSVTGVAISSGCLFGLLSFGLFQTAKYGYDDIEQQVLDAQI